MVCPLCKSSGTRFDQERFYLCDTCGGLYRPQHDYPGLHEERTRYEEHQNDVNDVRYQQFVSPITNVVQKEQPKESIGLDFGSGPAPVISKVLSDLGYTIRQYDPIFCPDEGVLQSNYDYIVCCEVIEHFHNPFIEFNRLKGLLKSNSRLYCMTLLYHSGIDFQNWHYRRDDTHVFIYQKKTLEWIQKSLDFSFLEIDDRLITFGN